MFFQDPRCGTARVVFKDRSSPFALGESRLLGARCPLSSSSNADKTTGEKRIEKSK